MGPALLGGLFGEGAGSLAAATPLSLPVQRRTLPLTCLQEVRTATLLPLEGLLLTHPWMSSKVWGVLPTWACKLLHSSCWLSMHDSNADVLNWSSVLSVSR